MTALTGFRSSQAPARFGSRMTERTPISRSDRSMSSVYCDPSSMIATLGREMDMEGSFTGACLGRESRTFPGALQGESGAGVNEKPRTASRDVSVLGAAALGLLAAVALLGVEPLLLGG